MLRGTRKTHFKRKNTRNKKNIRKQRRTKNANKNRKLKRRRTRMRGGSNKGEFGGGVDQISADNVDGQIKNMNNLQLKDLINSAGLSYDGIIHKIDLQMKAMEAKEVLKRRMREGGGGTGYSNRSGGGGVLLLKNIPNTS